ncbi:hypothetical protein B0T21DRAFT_413367 [Apiosordaria backusii]|uniref:Uncharacterized protein n=1 Tax=Apiosordaria backusii TaxID=314023 RepID=A0AA40B7W5_9PEZI|nr:hypothetical protein B0T21DRAFT_413367 [Apiosordaria backusii]
MAELELKPEYRQYLQHDLYTTLAVHLADDLEQKMARNRLWNGNDTKEQQTADQDKADEMASEHFQKIIPKKKGGTKSITADIIRCRRALNDMLDEERPLNSIQERFFVQWALHYRTVLTRFPQRTDLEAAARRITQSQGNRNLTRGWISYFIAKHHEMHLVEDLVVHVGTLRTQATPPPNKKANLDITRIPKTPEAASDMIRSKIEELGALVPPDQQWRLEYMVRLAGEIANMRVKRLAEAGFKVDVAANASAGGDGQAGNEGDSAGSASQDNVVENDHGADEEEDAAHELEPPSDDDDGDMMEGLGPRNDQGKKRKHDGSHGQRDLKEAGQEQ